MTTDLERRYERLLRLYPAWYRSARGAEMLAVLLESADPGRRRPPIREQWALLIGALRVRTGASGHRAAGVSWRHSLHTAALMLLLLNAGYASTGIFSTDIDFGLIDLTTIVLTAVAVLDIIRNRYLTATMVTAAMILLTLVPRLGAWISYGQPLAVVIVLLIPLIRRGPVTVPRSFNYVAALATIPIFLMVSGTATREPDFQTGSRTTWPVLLIGAIVWAVVDERVALTIGLVLLFQVEVQIWFLVDQVRYGNLSDWPYRALPIAISLIMPLIGIVCGGILARRRARL